MKQWDEAKNQLIIQQLIKITQMFDAGDSSDSSSSGEAVTVRRFLGTESHRHSQDSGVGPRHKQWARSGVRINRRITDAWGETLLLMTCKEPENKKESKDDQMQEKRNKNTLLFVWLGSLHVLIKHAAFNDLHDDLKVCETF